ncbi:MAG: nuclear transport factor 2 family protein [Actinomycetota bacterium]|jgi:ketosteroid isomerase-like protein|nr:nuclear transport factor 2 family protein [Actinomycetota bacterium]
MTDQPATSPTSSEEVVKGFLFGGDPALFAEDGRLVNPLPEELPYGGVYVGPEGVRRYIDELQAALRIESLKASQMISSGDQVVVIGTERSRFHSNGQTYEMDWVHVNTVRDAKIVEMREYNDTAAMLEAFRLPAAEGGV